MADRARRQGPVPAVADVETAKRALSPTAALLSSGRRGALHLGRKSRQTSQAPYDGPSIAPRPDAWERWSIAERLELAGAALQARGASVLAGITLFASPAPAGATPYTVATEQLVLQLGQAPTRTRVRSLGACRSCPAASPGSRWSTDLPDAEASTSSPNCRAARVSTTSRRYKKSKPPTSCPTTPATTRPADRPSR